MKKQILVFGIAMLIGLSACTRHETVKPKPQVQKVEAIAPLDAAVAGDWRKAQAKRDVFRHPKQTLEFFGLKPGQTVIEVFPGGGWYTSILAPYIKSTGGHYIAATFDPQMGERFEKSNQRFAAKFSDKDRFGEVQMRPFGPKSGKLCDGCADLVLTFRNVHSFMGRDYADKAFKDFYQALKPGGILGVVEHRLPETAEQNPKAPTGYVQESYVKDLAKQAGFEFIGESNVNANPKDNADHPYGVWTLPPTSRTPKPEDTKAADFDAEKYKAIGESDRFTLKFRKPLRTSGD